MATAVNLAVQAGVPFRRSIRVVDGKDMWANLTDFEVLAQIRSRPNELSDLLLDVTPFLSQTFDGNDIVITWSMTGADTRALNDPLGYYDVIVSDVGTTDARALRILEGEWRVSPATTAATRPVPTP